MIAFGTVAFSVSPLRVAYHLSLLSGRPSSEKVVLKVGIVVVEVLVDVDVVDTD